MKPERRLRAAIYCRLSRDDDASTSIATQEQDGRAWCELRGYDVVLVAHDVGVSGSIRPEDRDGFGEILDGIHGVDVVVARSLDRYSRVTSHFAHLVETLDKQGATLADVHGQCDLTSPYGRFVVTLMIAFAQLERETIQQRILRSRVELRRTGKWLGGAAPYGFQIVLCADGGKRLDVDTRSAAVLRQVIERVISGVTLSQEVERLTVTGVLCPGDYRKALRGELPPPAPGYGSWTYSALYQHLRSPVLRGYRVQGKRKGRRIVRDAEGRPVQVGPPLITADQWRALQATLDANGRKTMRPRRKSTLLLHVAWCPRCDEPMYYNDRLQNGKPSGFYSCHASRLARERAKGKCPGVAVTAALVEAVVEDWVMTRYGPTPYTERVLVGGSSSRANVDELNADLDELAAMARGLRGAAQAAVMKQMEGVQEELEEALSAPVEAPRWEWRETGETVAQRWENGDTAVRRLMLLELGIRADVHPAKSRKWDPERVYVHHHSTDPARDEADAVAMAEELADEMLYG